MARAVKLVIFALFLPLLPIVSPTANADFYNFGDLNLSRDSTYYVHVDRSSTGSVVATAQGCQLCYLFTDNGYALVSTDEGANFTEITSIGTQSWRAVDVSSDGTRIVFFAGTAFFISTDTGATFTKVDVFPAEYLQRKSEIIDGAISGDGKTIFIAESIDRVGKFTYKTNLKRWTSDFLQLTYGERVPTSIATNYNGTKTFIASNQTGITLLTGSTVSIIANTETWNGEILQWGEVRTSDSGNEVIAFANIESRGGTVFKSNNGGTSFTALTSVNGQNVPPVTSVEVSGDGNASFFATWETVDAWQQPATLYTQHGKTSSWFPRKVFYDTNGYTHIRTDYEGSTVIGAFGMYVVRKFKGAPIPPQITGVNVTSSNALSVAWSAGFDAGSDQTQALSDVLVEYSTSSTGPWTSYSDGVSGGSSGSSIVSGLAGRTTYYFRLKGKNSFGTSEYSEVASGYTYQKPTTPPAPTLLSTPQTWSEGYKFNDPTDFGGATTYTEREWQYSTNGGQTWNASSSASFSGTFGRVDGVSALILSEVPGGTSVSIRTRYSNGVFWSDWSDGTTGTFYTTPLAPQNLQVSTVLGTATLTWAPPADLGGYTLASYRLGYKLSNNSGWSSATTTETGTTISGLTVGTNYDFRVFAVTTDGTNSFVTYSYNNLTSTPARKLAMNRNSAGIKSGAAFTTQPKVSILDSSNNIVSADSVSIIYAEVNKGAIFISADSATAVSGVATFSNLGIKGISGSDYTITYRSGDLIIASETVTLLAGQKASMRFSQNTVGGVNGVVFPTQPQVEILDAEGNRVTWDETTTVTMTTNNGSLGNSSTSSTAQASSGVAAFTGESIRAAFGTPAVLTYSTSGLTSIQETLTVAIGAPRSFERVTRAQNAYIGGKFGVQPTYRISDIGNNTIADGDYYVSIQASRGTLTGQTTVRAIDGIATFTNLGLVGVDAGQMVTLSVYSAGLTTYTGDSVITLQSKPRLSWNSYYVPLSTAPFTIPAPDSNTAGTFTYTSSNTGVLSISGSTVTVVGAGTSTVTATFTPSSTTNFTSGETVTSTFTVSPSAGTLVVALSGGSTVAKGVIKTITATASDAGAVTFFINGKRVPGCIGIKTQSSVATCNWKPNAQGGATLSAILVPSNAQLNPVTSGTVNLAIGRRTGRR